MVSTAPRVLFEAIKYFRRTLTLATNSAMDETRPMEIAVGLRVLLKEDNEPRIYADNIRLARWVQEDITASLDFTDLDIPIAEAEFSRAGTLAATGPRASSPTPTPSASPGKTSGSPSCSNWPRGTGQTRSTASTLS